MRKTIVILISLFISALVLSMLVACEPRTKTELKHEPQYFTIEFLALNGGRIEGVSIQTVKEGENTEMVAAVADTGYYFMGWSGQGIIQEDESIKRDELVVENVSESRIYVANFRKITLSITYIAGEHGSIQGETYQSLKYKDNATSVTALPDVGYKFVKWSDGVETATRQDIGVTESKSLTAIFELITNTYLYNYKFATENCDNESVTLTYGQLDNVQLATPMREHCVFGGWYADRYLTVQIADSNGKIIIDDELFYSDCTEFYAKWINDNENEYKILIVYVTELNAELMTLHGYGKKQVNYKMTETEKKISQMITEKVRFELNDLAVTNFRVDEYFTTIPLTTDNVEEELVYRIAQKRHVYEHHIWAYDIPEVSMFLNDYDSVLVSFSMEDYSDNMCINDGGLATAKYASIHLDHCLEQLLLYHESFENLLDPLHYYWDHILDTFLHEFVHTVESQIELQIEDFGSFHEAVGAYLWDNTDRLIAHKLYLLNRALVNGKITGIPYEFWQGKMTTYKHIEKIVNQYGFKFENKLEVYYDKNKQIKVIVGVDCNTDFGSNRKSCSIE